jgi:hypothetical protein
MKSATYKTIIAVLLVTIGVLVFLLVHQSVGQVNDLSDSVLISTLIDEGVLERVVEYQTEEGVYYWTLDHVNKPGGVAMADVPVIIYNNLGVQVAICGMAQSGDTELCSLPHNYEGVQIFDVREE